MSDTNPALPQVPPVQAWPSPLPAPAPASIRSAVAKTILLFAACVLVMQLIGGLLGGILAVLNPAVLDAIRQAMAGGSVDIQTIMQNPAYAQAIGPATLIGSIVGEALGICCFFFLRGKKLVTSDISTTRPVGSRWGQLGTAVLLVFAVQLVLSLLNALIGMTGYDPSQVQSTLLDPVMSSPLGMVAAVFLLPFFEELIFRGAILRHLVPFGVNFAIVTQAVLFGLWHLNLYQGIFAVPMGLILGYVAYHFSLKWSFALHALNNGFAMLMSLSWMPGWVAPAIMAVAGLGAVAVLILHRGQIKPILAEGAPVRPLVSPLQPLPVGAPTLPVPEWAPPGGALVIDKQPSPFRVGWASPAFIVVTAIMFVICCLMMTIA